MRITQLSIPVMLTMASCASAPTPMSDDVVQTLEWSRIVAPEVSKTRDGRRYIEFAPTIETRNIRCEALADGAYDCRFESRLRGAFESEFSEWISRHERIVFRSGCWRFD